jgi:RNA polymerase sigma factor (sigma-70 family)
VGHALEAGGRAGAHGRDAGAAAWARSARPSSCPDRAVAGAYRELRASVSRGLAFRTGCADLAEDLTQDVFVDLLLASRRHPPDNPRAWLARVAQRRVADSIGSAVRERDARARLAAAARPEAAGPPEPEVRLVLRAGVARLTPSQQRILDLRLVQGKSFAHCGSALGQSEDAARMRFNRAVAALRRGLDQADAEEALR